MSQYTGVGSGSFGHFTSEVDPPVHGSIFKDSDFPSSHLTYDSLSIVRDGVVQRYKGKFQETSPTS